MRLAGDFLPGLVALAGQQHHVLRARPAPACRRWPCARSGSTCAASGRGEAQQDLADDRRGLFAARVVAGHDHAVGLLLGHRAPSCGRLPASRSPPQPNTHHSWPPRCRGQRAQAGQRLVERIGRVRVVDHHQRLARPARRAPCGPGTLRAARRPPTASRQRQPERAQRAQHAQQVGDVVLADQLRRSTLAARALLDHREAQACRAVADVARRAGAPRRRRPRRSRQSSAPTPASRRSPTQRWRRARRRC